MDIAKEFLDLKSMVNIEKIYIYIVGSQFVVQTQMNWVISPMSLI